MYLYLYIYFYTYFCISQLSISVYLQSLLYSLFQSRPEGFLSTFCFLLSKGQSGPWAVRGAEGLDWLFFSPFFHLVLNVSMDGKNFFFSGQSDVGWAGVHMCPLLSMDT